MSQALGRVPSVDEQSDSLAFLEMRNRMEIIRKDRPTVALVLGGGGALGAAHIGVIKYLDELGVPVDMVVGTSIGGLVGGIYSLGYTGEQIDSLFKSVDWSVMMSDAVPANLYSTGKRNRVEKYCLDIPFLYDDTEWERRQSLGSEKPVRKQNFISSITEGYLYGFNVYNMFNSKTAGYQDYRNFLDLPTPFVCTSTDVVSGKTKNWTEGAIVDALRSTMSIPLAFMPVRKDDKVYIDGGICNNFPVDIARAMGADIVIGVDLHLPSTLEEASSVVQLVYMTATRPGSNQSYDNNIKDADIFLEPDMSNYNLLSFNAYAIDDLTRRGYETAISHKAELDAIVAKTGKGGRKLSAPKPADISNKAVKINSIEFVGMADEEIDFFLPKLGLKAGKSYTAADFEKAVAKVYGSGIYSRATYQLIGESEPYRYVLVCEKGPVNDFLLGLRADSEGLISAAFGYGRGVNNLLGSKFMLSGEVGKFSSLRLDWGFAPVSYLSLNTYFQTSYSAFRGLDVIHSDVSSGSYHGELWHNELGFFVNENYFENIDINLGLKVENTPVLREYEKDRVILNNWKSVWSYAFLNVSYNSLDDKYFPTRGWKASAGCDYLLGGRSAVYGEKISKTRYASFDVTVPVTITERFTVIPSIYSRLIVDSDELLSSYYMGNAIGGAMFGRYFAHQIPFVGYNGVKRVGDRLGMAGLDLRYKATSKAYLSLIGQMYNDNIGKGNWNDFAVYAAAVQCSVKTPVGPISTNVHWNSDTGRVGFYISAGFDF